MGANKSPLETIVVSVSRLHLNGNGDPTTIISIHSNLGTANHIVSIVDDPVMEFTDTVNDHVNGGADTHAECSVVKAGADAVEDSEGDTNSISMTLV